MRISRIIATSVLAMLVAVTAAGCSAGTVEFTTSTGVGYQVSKVGTGVMGAFEDSPEGCILGVTITNGSAEPVPGGQWELDLDYYGLDDLTVGAPGPEWNEAYADSWVQPGQSAAFARVYRCTELKAGSQELVLGDQVVTLNW